jgi:SAM-dependent methyltransferase
MIEGMEYDEVSIGLSYFRLYAEAESNKKPGEQPSSPDDDALSYDDTQVPWRPDEWTQQDEQRAADILCKHRDRCKRKDLQKLEVPTDSWDKFYSHHGVKFFHDRHYLQKEFPEEFSDDVQPNSRTLVEVGCGVGNNILPLIEHATWACIWGLDLSAVAIDLLRRDARFQKERERAHADVWDITIPDKAVLPWFGVADVTTLLFCLSALHPSDMKVAAQNVIHTLKVGGTLLFRDYGRYDEAQLKLATSRGKELGENYYRKHDGTTCYYFTLDDLERLFGTEMEVLELRYLRQVFRNRAEEQERRRVWVQGRFRKSME